MVRQRWCVKDGVCERWRVKYLSTTIFHTPSLSTIFVNQHLSHISLSTIFVHHHLSHAIFHTHHLSHTIFVSPSFTRHLSHTIFVNHHLSPFCHAHLCHTLTSTFVSRGRRGTWRHLLWFCVAGVALGDIHLGFASRLGPHLFSLSCLSRPMFNFFFGYLLEEVDIWA